MSLRGRIAVRFAGVATSALMIFAFAMPAFGAIPPAATSSGNGLRISPVTSNLTIAPGDSQTVQVSVQNVTQATVTLQVLVNDFTAGDNETGIPALLLNPDQYAPSHSLKRYVAPISDFTLGPGGQKSVTVTVTIPKDAAGGGYYGAVRFVPKASSSSSNVTLSASVGSLILVRVPGDVKEDLNLISLDVRASENDSPQVVFTSGNNLVVLARFQNLGDVQEQPFGKVALKQGSTQLATYEINSTTPRGNVLPASIRRFSVTLDKVGSFGQYTVYGNFGYGTSGQLLSGKTTFYVIPVGAILAVLAVIIIVLLAIFVLPRLIRGYNRRIINASRRS